MASCKIVNADVLEAVKTIETISKNYQTAGDNFVKDLNSAINEMEGAAKDAFKTLIDKDVKDFVADQLPKAVQGMSALLEGNRKNFEEVDGKIAESISGGS